MIRRINRPNGPARRNTDPVWRAGTASSLAETVTHAVLCLTGLAAVVVAVSWASAPAPPTGNSVARRGGSSAVESFSVDRFTADVRSAFALVRYLLEPESDGASNFSGAVSTQQPGLAPATNAAIAKPRV